MFRLLKKGELIKVPLPEFKERLAYELGWKDKSGVI